MRIWRMRIWRMRISFERWLQQVQRAGSAAARDRIHRNQEVISVEQTIREVEAGDPDIGELDLVTERRLAAQPLHHLDAKAIIAEKDVADAGY
jgi:hypothetical protein